MALLQCVRMATRLSTNRARAYVQTQTVFPESLSTRFRPSLSKAGPTILLGASARLHRGLSFHALGKEIEHEVDLLVRMRRHHGNPESTRVVRDRWWNDR